MTARVKTLSPLIRRDADRVLVVGHRGAAGHAPENTAASFQAALHLGADAVECDVHLSRDGEPIVIHDDRLDRTTDGCGFVRDHEWKALRGLNAGGWFSRRYSQERLWRLKDFLRWVKSQKTRGGRRLRAVVEIKSSVDSAALADRVAAEILAARMSSRTWVISFDRGALRRMKRAAPFVPTGILFGRRWPGAVRWARASGVQALFPRWTLATPALIRAAHASGLRVGCYTVDGAADLRRVVNRGVDAVSTNFPDRLARVVGAKARRLPARFPTIHG